MRVIPVGYGNREHRDLIARLMYDEMTLLVDIRFSKQAAIPGWHGTSLLSKYSWKYIYMGKMLGNRNYKNDKPIEIVDLAGGLVEIFALLQNGYTVLLLCGCGSMEPTKEHPYGCHRKVIVDALAERWSEVEIVLPEAIIAKEQTLETLRDEREALYKQLNGIKPTMANYWSLPVSEQGMVRREKGLR